MSDPVLLKTAEQVRDDILAEVSAQTGIRDNNLGANIRTEAFAFGIEAEVAYYMLLRAQRAAYIKTATGTALDQRGADYDLDRRGGVFAVGTERFTGTPGTVITPATTVSVPATTSADRIQFSTTNTVGQAIPGGGTLDLGIIAVVAGEDGNVGAGTITDLDTPISGLTSVTNPAVTLLGASEEDDDSYRTRILAWIAGLSKGTVPAIISGSINFEVQKATLAVALPAGQLFLEVEEDLNTIPFSVQGARYLELQDASGVLVEVVLYTGIDTTTTPQRFTGLTRAQFATADVAHEVGGLIEEYIPQSSGHTVTSASVLESPGHVDVYIDDGTTAGPDPLLVDLVEKRLRGDGTDRDPGWKPAGVTLNTTARSVSLIDVTATIQVSTSYDAAEVKATTLTTITEYLNGFKVGVDVLAYPLVEVIMAVDGVIDITSLLINAVLFDGAVAADVAVPINTVARANTISVP